MEHKLIPLSVPNLSLDILENVKEVIETGWVSTGGRFIDEFESKVAQYVGVEKAVSCQSGTSGLHLALRVLGVEKGDEVIVPALTFIAAVNPVRYVGAEPIFMDCDESLNMDMEKLDNFLKNECQLINGNVINKRTKKVIKAVIVVHVFGNPANMERLMEIGAKYQLKIIEDATEALGSYYLSGKYANQHCGTIGDIGVYSFNANKIITTGGGGMIVSHDTDLLNEIAYLSIQAKTDSLYFIHDDVGYNYRLTNLQAAFGTNQIDRLECFIARKIQHYALYKEAIEAIDGLELLQFADRTRANHWFYSIRVNKEQYGLDRDELLYALNNFNIQTRPLWSLIHKQKPYSGNQAYQVEKALIFERDILNVPCSSHLTKDEIDRVIGTLKNVKQSTWVYR
jgi:perosamine synthetase